MFCIKDVQLESSNSDLLKKITELNFKLDVVKNENCILSSEGDNMQKWIDDDLLTHILRKY